MKKYLPALLLAATVIGMPSAQAQSDAAAPKKAAKKTAVKKAAPDKQAPADDEKEIDTASATATDFHCELGNKLTIYRNTDDDQHIALRWQQRLHRLARVDTSTGAQRFENHKYGLVWIGIPAKGMLLDSKKGRQLANECKTAEQMAPKG